MRPEFVETNVLITVMTYPHPSQRHQELVCTAGITEAGEWVRLYPIDYRYRPSMIDCEFMMTPLCCGSSRIDGRIRQHVNRPRVPPMRSEMSFSARLLPIPRFPSQES